MSTTKLEEDMVDYSHSVANSDGALRVSGSSDNSEKADLERAAPPAEHPPTPALQFPEGGRQAWLTVFGGSMVVFCTFGVVQSFGVYQDYYTRISLNEHSPSAISWIGSVQVFLLFALGLPAGRLFDKGYFHHCIISGSLIYLFSVFMLSLTKPHHYYQTFLAQGVGMGLGMGLLFLPTISVASHYFRKRRSVAMGAILSGSSIGGLLYPIMLNNIFRRADGFGWGVRAVGFIDIALLVSANLLMRTRLPSRKNAKPVDIKKILFDASFILYVVGNFLIFWGIFVPFFYLQLYAALHGVNASFVSYAIPIMNAASIFGRTLPNFLADSYGPFNVIIPCSVVSGGLVYAMLGGHTVGNVVVFGILFGFFSGGFVTMATPAAATFCTTSDLSDMGVRLGILSFAIGCALLTGSPIAGALLSPPHYVWWRPLVAASSVVFGGSVCLILARRGMVKRKGTQLV